MAMPRAKRGAKAWLVRWRAMPGQPAFDAPIDEPIAILSSRWSPERVMEHMERLYFERAASKDELLSWRDSSKAPYRPTIATGTHGIPIPIGLVCGHNPVLSARLVDELTSTSEDSLRWRERFPPHYAHICEIAGEPNCPLIGKPPKYTWREWSPAPSSAQG